MVYVVVGLIWYKEKFVIAKRTFGDKEAMHKWEFPGGKIDILEDEETSLKREIVEELGIEVRVKGFLAEHTQVYEKRAVNIKLYFCEHVRGIVTINSEHLEFALVDFVDILKYDLAPADRELYSKIDISVLSEYIGV